MIPLSLLISVVLITDEADLPLRQGVFDVVQGGVDKDPTIVPSGRLDPDSLMDEGTLAK